MSDGSSPHREPERQFPTARPVSTDLSLSRGERRRASTAWSPFVWLCAAVGCAFLGLVVALMVLGPR